MAAFSASEVNSALTEFLTERHLAILTLVRPDGRPHSTPIGFMWDEESEVVKIIRSKPRKFKIFKNTVLN